MEILAPPEHKDPRDPWVSMGLLELPGQTELLEQQGQLDRLGLPEQQVLAPRAPLELLVPPVLLGCRDLMVLLAQTVLQGQLEYRDLLALPDLRGLLEHLVVQVLMDKLVQPGHQAHQGLLVL